MSGTNFGASVDVAGVDFYSPIGIVGGLGSAGRAYLSALRAASIPTSVIALNEMFVHHPSVGLTGRRSERPRYPISLVHVNADSVRRFVHFRGRSFARARYKIGLWVWELPALRDEWLSAINQFDEIWVPSTFNQRAVLPMTAKPVMVVPYVVSPPANNAPDRGYRERLRIESGEFVFLYVFDAASFVTRKNPHCLVDAFEAAFPDDDRVRLVLKTTNAEFAPELSEYLDGVAGRNSRCVVLRGTMDSHELAALVAACNCYVSPHRSEGFGLTVAEAMVCGLPVIATDYGATVDFVTDEVGFPLRYRLIEVGRDLGPYAKGAIWADPSRDDLKELLRWVVANPEAAAAKGERGRSRILSHYSAEAVGRRIADRLRSIAWD